MPQIERQVVVNAPPSKVFSYLADFPRHSEWTAQAVRIQQTSEGAAGAGTTFSSAARMLGRELKDRLTVTEFVPDSRIVFETEGDTGRFRHYFALQEESGATRLSKGMEPLQLAGAFKLLSPVLNALLAPRAIAADLRRIKARLEGGA